MAASKTASAQNIKLELNAQIEEMELKVRLADLQAQYNELILRRDTARDQYSKYGKK